MHAAALQYATEMVAVLNLNTPQAVVLDLGGRDVNGTTRHLFPDAERYVSVDIVAGRGVDIVGDAADVDLGSNWDVVITTELLEHTPKVAQIIVNAYRHLKPGGVFLATMAGPGRKPHSAGGRPRLPPGEHYENVDPAELAVYLKEAGFEDFEVDQLADDVRCWARR